MGRALRFRELWGWTGGGLLRPRGAPSVRSCLCVLEPSSYGVGRAPVACCGGVWMFGGPSGCDVAHECFPGSIAQSGAVLGRLVLRSLPGIYPAGGAVKLYAFAMAIDEI